MNKLNETDEAEMQPEYDFSGGVRGKYAKRLAKSISLPRQKSRQMQQVPARGDLHLTMSYADFLTQVDESKQAEWINGETIIFMPPGRRHQTLITFLVELIGLFVRYRQLGELLVAAI